MCLKQRIFLFRQLENERPPDWSHLSVLSQWHVQKRNWIRTFRWSSGWVQSVFKIAHLSQSHSDIVTLSITTIAAFSSPKCWFCAGEAFTCLSVTHRSRKQDAIVALRADGEVGGVEVDQCVKKGWNLREESVCVVNFLLNTVKPFHLKVLPIWWS